MTSGPEKAELDSVVQYVFGGGNLTTVRPNKQQQNVKIEVGIHMCGVV